jgi:hypothetical protein
MKKNNTVSSEHFQNLQNHRNRYNDRYHRLTYSLSLTFLVCFNKKKAGDKLILLAQITLHYTFIQVFLLVIDRQSNGQKDKQWYTKHYTAKQRSSNMNPTGGELSCSGSVSSPCSTRGTRRVTRRIQYPWI